MNNTMKDEDIMPLSPEEIKAIGTIGIGPSKQDIFLNKHYRKLILAGVIVATAASLGIAWFSHSNDRKAEAGAQIVAALQADKPTLMLPADAYAPQCAELVMEEYADTPSSPTADLLTALSGLSKGEEEAKKALAGLEALANNAAITPLLRARALCSLATHAMQNGDDAAASTHWNALISLGESPYSALAYMSLGDMAKTAGKKDEARQHYQQAMTTCQTSQLVQDQNVIATRLMLLDVDAPRPVAPAPKKEEYRNPFDSPLDAAPTPALPAGDDLFSGGSTMPGQPQQ